MLCVFHIFCKNFLKISVACVATKLKKNIRSFIDGAIPFTILHTLRPTHSFDELQSHFALLVSAGSL